MHKGLTSMVARGLHRVNRESNGEQQELHIKVESELCGVDRN